MLSMRNVQVSRGGRMILAVDELHFEPGRFTVILGHNGSGKSTLVNLLAGQSRPDNGSIELHGRPLDLYRQRDLARRIAFLPQRLPEVPGLTVRELVRLGRFAWRGVLGRWQPEDQAFTEQAMQQTDTLRYADYLAETLSGGERQRAWIAMLLAQRAPLILLDEPTSALDLAHQYELMALLGQLNHDSRLGIVCILHDINLAARYADRVVALKNGRVFFDGSPAQLLSAPLLSDLYGIDIGLVQHPGQAHKLAVVS